VAVTPAATRRMFIWRCKRPGIDICRRDTGVRSGLPAGELTFRAYVVGVLRKIIYGGDMAHYLTTGMGGGWGSMICLGGRAACTECAQVGPRYMNMIQGVSAGIAVGVPKEAHYEPK